SLACFPLRFSLSADLQHFDRSVLFPVDESVEELFVFLQTDDPCAVQSSGPAFPLFLADSSE
ncbi:MAG: hypothetical protein IJD43_12900, partial [Thermoguttaceae bacterium]|nr:hypothetical protein [Thermoguttaceae bacterium]